MQARVQQRGRKTRLAEQDGVTFARCLQEECSSGSPVWGLTRTTRWIILMVWKQVWSQLSSVRLWIVLEATSFRKSPIQRAVSNWGAYDFLSSLELS